MRNSQIITNNSLVSGDYRDSIRLNAGRGLQHHSVCNDRLRMECHQILVVPVFHLLLVILLHLLRNDDRRRDSKPSHRLNHLVGLLRTVEPLLRIRYPSHGKKYIYEYLLLFLSKNLHAIFIPDF